MKEKASPLSGVYQSMSRRRISCPQMAQQLWDVVRDLRSAPTTERVQKMMQKEFGVSEDEVSRQLEYCVRDGLLEVTTRTVSKGSNVGSAQCWYKLPTLKLIPDDYDWYCFDCQLAGDVVRCSKPGCLKVYHLACISNKIHNNHKFVCEICQMCQKTSDKFTMKRSKFNRLLGLPLSKLKAKYPVALKDQRIPPPNKNILVSDRSAQALLPASATQSDESESWRSLLLIAREMNLFIVEEKIDRHRYKLLEEFYADCLNIKHNILIYNGVNSLAADKARQMVRDCEKYMQEIRDCVDCFKFSQGHKKQRFEKPCRKPHELVYVKQSGQPLWPAKVLKADGSKYIVRLFGPPHPLIEVERSQLKPINTNVQLQKRPSNWNRACDELKKHQELVEKWRVSTREYTVFEESSSSDESDSVDSDTQRKMERDWRVARITQIVEKQDMTPQKQKQAGRKPISARPPTGERKRGRPRLSDAATPKTTPSGKLPGRPGRKRTYSSDSMDSFNVPIDPLPKKNTDEMFDELLKSEPSKSLTSLASKSGKKGGELPKRPQARAPAIKRDTSDDSKTRDSSSFSVQDDSQRVQKFRSSSSDDSDSESDMTSSASTKLTSLAAATPVAARGRPGRPKKPERPAVKPVEASDESSSSDSESDPPKPEPKNIPNGKADESSSQSSDSESDDEDDDNDDASASNKSKGTNPAKSVKTIKPKGTAKRKSSLSSDTESLDRSKTLKAKTKVAPLTKAEDIKIDENKQTRRSSRNSGPSKDENKPTPRSSQRTLRKVTSRKDTNEDEDDSSDSEAPLKKKIGIDIRGKYATRNEESSKSSESDSKAASDSESEEKEPVPKLKVDLIKKVSVNLSATDRKSKNRRDTNELTKDVKEEIVVSSSSQEPVTRSVEVQTESPSPENSQETKNNNNLLEEMQELKDRLDDELDRRTRLENELDQAKEELEQLRLEHIDKIKDVETSHKTLLSETKKKQWCYNCEAEAIYHCCWNTAYCSVECQQAHWQTEHKRVCRRKR